MPSFRAVPLSEIGRWIRERPFLTGLLCVIAFLAAVPVRPYKPHCGTYGTTSFRTLEGEMSKEFLAAMEVALSDLDISYWRMGDRINLPIPTVLDRSGELDLGRGDLLNAQLFAVTDLVQTDFGGHAGKALDGRIYQPPLYLTKLYEQDESLVFGDDCTFVRAVAFGELPPPDYAPASTTESLPPDPRSDVD